MTEDGGAFSQLLIGKPMKPSSVRHPEEGANGHRVGQRLKRNESAFKAWRTMCSKDGLRKIGVIFCEYHSTTKEKCTCRPLTIAAVIAGNYAYRLDSNWRHIDAAPPVHRLSRQCTPYASSSSCRSPTTTPQPSAGKAKVSRT